MADNRKSYNAVVRAFEQKHGLTRAQARVVWRSLRDRLDKTPRLADLKKHPRITAQEVKRGPARERALRAAKTRAANKAKAAAPPKKPAPPKRPPKAKAMVAGAGAGAGPVSERIPPEFLEYEGEIYEGMDFGLDDEESF